MCGIAGIFNLDGKKVNRKMLHAMDDAIAHRGPDDHGEMIEWNVGLANRRLAIIDVSPAGHQPMKTNDGSLWITFNGEIFNYKELKQLLEKKGYRFHSHSDTETILHGYQEFGKDILNKIKGQFAFCIWDKRNGSLFLARDHVGINPLFYSKLGNTFLFGSEVKAILASGVINKELNPEAVHHYLSMFVVPAPHTIFAQIKNLLPGHYLYVDAKKVTMKKYWEMPVGLWRGETFSFHELKNNLRQELELSVLSSTLSDVPVGAFLSGGIDSSSIVGILASKSKHPIRTFSLWAEGGTAFDERKYARMVVDRFGTDHTEATVTDRDVKSELSNIIRTFDQPTGGSLETYFVSQIAAKKVKVALSGLGGDELFAGYHADIYKTHLFGSIYRKIPQTLRDAPLKALTSFIPNNNTKKTIRIGSEFLALTDALKQRLFYYFVFTEVEKRRLYNQSFSLQTTYYNTETQFEKIWNVYKDEDTIDRLSYLDMKTYTRDDLLLGMNMTSMSHSLEVRVPFLNTGLIELSSHIAPHFKYTRGITKFILKEAMKDLLPSEVISHKKTGFGLPRIRYMRGVLKPIILEVLQPSSIRKRGIFDEKSVSRLVSQLYSEKSDKLLWREHLRVWILFIFELWAREFLD